MTVKPLPNHEYLKSILKYHPHNGIFVWKVSRGRRKRGDLANSSREPYSQIKIDGKLYMAHRLAYYYVTGIDPVGLVIDHIDCNRHNNAFANLRAVTVAENNANRAKPARDCTYRRGRWEAQFTLKGRHYYCGVFSTMEAAQQAAVELRSSLTNKR